MTVNTIGDQTSKIKQKLYFAAKQKNQLLAHTIKQLNTSVFEPVVEQQSKKDNKSVLNGDLSLRQSYRQDVVDTLVSIPKIFAFCTQNKELQREQNALLTYNARAYALLTAIEQNFDKPEQFYYQRFMSETATDQVTYANEMKVLSRLNEKIKVVLAGEQSIEMKGEIQQTYQQLMNDMDVRIKNIKSLLLNEPEIKNVISSSGNVIYVEQSLLKEEQAVLLDLLVEDFPIVFVENDTGIKVSVKDASNDDFMVDCRYVLTKALQDVATISTEGKQLLLSFEREKSLVEYKNSVRQLLTQCGDKFLNQNPKLQRECLIDVDLAQLSMLGAINQIGKKVIDNRFNETLRGLLTLDHNEIVTYRDSANTLQKAPLSQLIEKQATGETDVLLSLSSQDKDLVLKLPHLLIDEKVARNNAGQKQHHFVVKQNAQGQFVVVRSIKEQALANLNRLKLPVPGEQERRKLLTAYKHKFTTERTTDRKTVINARLQKKDILAQIAGLSPEQDYEQAKAFLRQTITPLSSNDVVERPSFFVSLNMQKNQSSGDCYGIDVTLYALKDDEIVGRNIAYLINQNAQQAPIVLSNVDKRAYGIEQSVLSEHGQDINSVDYKISEYFKRYIPHAIIKMEHKQSADNLLAQFPLLKKELDKHLVFDGQQLRQESKITHITPYVSRFTLDSNKKRSIYFADCPSGTTGVIASLKKGEDFSAYSLDGEYLLNYQQSTDELILRELATGYQEQVTNNRMELIDQLSSALNAQNSSNVLRTPRLMQHCHLVKAVLDQLSTTEPAYQRHVINQSTMKAVDDHYWQAIQTDYRFDLTIEDNITIFEKTHQMHLKSMVNEQGFNHYDLLHSNLREFLANNPALQDLYAEAPLYHLFLENINPNSQKKPIEEMQELASRLQLPIEKIEQLYSTLYEHQKMQASKQTLMETFFIDERVKSPFLTPELTYDIKELSLLEQKGLGVPALMSIVAKQKIQDLIQQAKQQTNKPALQITNQALRGFNSLLINDSDASPKIVAKQNKILQQPMEKITTLTSVLNNILVKNNAPKSIDNQSLIEATAPLFNLLKQVNNDLLNSGTMDDVNLLVSQENQWWNNIRKMIIALVEQHDKVPSMMINRDIKPDVLKRTFINLRNGLDTLYTEGVIAMSQPAWQSVLTKIDEQFNKAQQEYLVVERVRMIYFQQYLEQKTTPVLSSKNLVHLPIENRYHVYEQSEMLKYVKSYFKEGEWEILGNKGFEREVDTIFSSNPMLMDIAPEFAISNHHKKNNPFKTLFSTPEIDQMMLSSLYKRIKVEQMVQPINKLSTEQKIDVSKKIKVKT